MSDLSISVVIPTYNRAELLTRSIRSALREMNRQDELILVDDGSSDNTASVVGQFGDRVRYIRIANSGAGKARNVGVKEAAGDLIAFLDSDDEYMPGRLELARRLLAARPDILFTFSDIESTRRNGRVERFFLKEWHHDPRPWQRILGDSRLYSQITSLPNGIRDFKVYVGDLYCELARHPYISTITVTVRRREAGPALYFDEDWPLYEDWGCFGRLARAGQVAYLEVETAWQHSHEGSRLVDARDLVQYRTRIAMLERIWGRDESFMATHAEELRELIDHQRYFEVRRLFVLGRRGEAAQSMRSLQSLPIIFRLLAIIPGPLTRLLVALLRPLKGLAHK